MKDVSNQIYAYVAGKINNLVLTIGDGPAKATLANLRRGAGHQPGDIPELWGYFLSDLPTDLQNSAKEPSKAEWAIYTALTLFALHQQGHDLRNDCMNQKGQGLGKAVRRLIPVGDQDAEKRILRRFNQLATSADMIEIAYYLRGMIQLLAAEGIPLDYPALSKDLYWFQYPETASNIRLSWGQSFYFTSNKENQEKQEGENNE